MLTKTVQSHTIEYKLLEEHGLCLHIMLCIHVYAPTLQWTDSSFEDS